MSGFSFTAIALSIMGMICFGQASDSALAASAQASEEDSASGAFDQLLPSSVESLPRFLAPRPDHLPTTSSISSSHMEFMTEWNRAVDHGPGLEMVLEAPKPDSVPVGIWLPVETTSPATRWFEVRATPQQGIGHRWYQAGHYVGTKETFPGFALPQDSPGFVIPLSRFVPISESARSEVLPRESLRLELRIVSPEVPTSQPALHQVRFYQSQLRWIYGNPGMTADAQLQPQIGGEENPLTATIRLGALESVGFDLRTSAGLVPAHGRLWIEGPDRDELNFETPIFIEQGQTTLTFWARVPGVYHLQLLEPDHGWRSEVVVEAVHPPDQPAILVDPELYLGRRWVTGLSNFPLDLITTPALSQEPQRPIRSIHIRVRDMLGQPVFARWFSPGDFPLREAFLPLPGFGLYTLEASACSLPAELVSPIPATLRLAPFRAPLSPFHLSSKPANDGEGPDVQELAEILSLPGDDPLITTRTVYGLLLALEEIPTTAPIVARDRVTLFVNQRSPNENILYGFPLGIEGGDDLEERPPSLARSLANAHRRLGSFWSSELNRFQEAVPAKGTMMFLGAQRFWDLRRPEYTKIAHVLTGKTAWTQQWPSDRPEDLQAFQSWVQELLRRYRQTSLWVVGRDVEGAGLPSAALSGPPAEPPQYEKLLRGVMEAFQETGLPHRIGFGATDGLRPHFLRRILEGFSPEQESLQALVYRPRAITGYRFPTDTPLPLEAHYARQILRDRALPNREVWWMPLEWSSHPGFSTESDQALAFSQLQAMAAAGRVTKTFWSRLGDTRPDHPADPHQRSGLMDQRLRPKPSLAAFLVKSWMLTLLQHEETRELATFGENQQLGSAAAIVHHFAIRTHSVKRAGWMTIAYLKGTPEGRSSPESSSGILGFPSAHWPYEPWHRGQQPLSFLYESRLGGPVFAINYLGAWVEPLEVEKLGQTALGPTGRYRFPVSYGPLLIWDTGLQWSQGQIKPQGEGSLDLKPLVSEQ